MRRLAEAIATLGGLGRVRYAPGTWGSLAGLLLAWWLTPTGAGLTWLPASFAYSALLIIGSLVGVAAAGRFARAEGRTDPPSAIVDECLGMLWSVAGLPQRAGVWIAGFVLFRLFDITKLGPIRRCEALPGGWGIMADDVAAGLLTNLLLRLACHFLPV